MNQLISIIKHHIIKLKLIFLLLPIDTYASSYPDPGYTYFIFLIASFIGGSLIYFVSGGLLTLLDRLSSLYMVPIVITLIAAVVGTVYQVIMVLIVGGFPSAILIGSLLSTWIYWILIKKHKLIPDRSRE